MPDMTRAPPYGKGSNTADVLAAFADAMRRRGLIPPIDLIPDGHIHRCAVEGARRGKRDGAYRLHPRRAPQQAASRNWKDGRPWQEWRYSNGTTELTPAERAAFDAKVAARKKADDEERQRLAEAAQREAIARFGNAGPADPRHPYLVEKQVRAHGLRQAGSELLVPRHDMASPASSSACSGSCRTATSVIFTGGRVDGTWHRHRQPGSRHDPLVARVLPRARRRTKSPAMRRSSPSAAATSRPRPSSCGSSIREARIIVLADDDWKEKGNPGLTAAKEAATARRPPGRADVRRPGPGGQGHRLQRHAPACWSRRRQGRDRDRQPPPIDWPDIDPALPRVRAEIFRHFRFICFLQLGANGSSQPPRARAHRSTTWPWRCLPAWPVSPAAE